MALIVCPECKKEISDQACVCPNCGYPLAKLESSVSFSADKPNSDIIVSKEGRNKKIIAIITALLLLAVVAVSIFFFVSKSNAANARKEYISNLSLAREAMLQGAADAEETCNLINSVWYNAIFKETDSSTDKYTRKPGFASSDKEETFYDDFNVALGNLFDSDEYQNSALKIETSQILVESYMKDLQSPPDDLKTCYDTLDDMYDEFSALTKLAVNPSGSLESFGESFRDSDSAFMKHYDKLGTQIPED